MTEALLDVEHIGVSYGDLRAVWDVSFTARRGEITVLLGRNGAGKSTSLLAVAGALALAAGTISLNGENLTRAPSHARLAAGISLVAENKRIFRQRTVEQNLQLGGWPARGDRRRTAASLERAYELFPALAAKRRHAAGTLSGGQQQMVAIAQALMADPSVLLLDEPSAGLAPVIVHDLMRVVTRLAADGLAVVMVEQMLQYALPYADTAIVIEQGRSVHEFTGGSIDADLIRDIYLGNVKPAAADAAHTTSPASADDTYRGNP